MKEIMSVIALSLGSIVTIFILTKLIGHRQVSQMSMFDYINGITIGSIAAEMSVSYQDDYIAPLTAMIVYGLFTLLVSFLCNKSIRVRMLFEGQPLLLLNEDKMNINNFKKAKMDIAEFQEQCRNSGYFDVSKLQSAVLEPNGKISFLPKASDRPLTPTDMQLNPQQDYMVFNVIIDGKVMQEGLRHTGNDEKWLQKQLSSQGGKQIGDVFLATCDRSNKLTLYLK